MGRQKSGFEGNSGRVISDAAFINRRVGYAVGYCTYQVPCDRNDILLKTSDGGASWHAMAPKTRLESKRNYSFSRLFVSRRSSRLIAYGNGGKIYLSRNRGILLAGPLAHLDRRGFRRRFRHRLPP